MSNSSGIRRSRATVRVVPNHKCELSTEENAANSRICQGIFVESRRRLWKLITVDAASPLSKKILKSAAQIHEEEIRHLDRHPYTIHPFSYFRYIWEIFMIPIWLSIFVYIPVMISTIDIGLSSVYTKLFFDIVCNIDIVIWFFTGYYDPCTQKVQLNLKKVAKHYICTYFFFDLVSSQPITLYLILSDEKAMHYLTVIPLLKIVRLRTLIQYIYQCSERLNVLTSNIKFWCFTLSMCVAMTWSASVIYMIIKLQDPAPLSRREIENHPMLLTTYKVIRMLMSIGVVDIVTTNNMIMLFEIVLIWAGGALEVTILAKIMQVYHKQSSSRSKYNNLLEEISGYMKYKELPPQLKDKILRYVDFKYQKHIFREEDVLNNLSSVLKHDILLQRCERMIKKVDFFKGLPRQVIVRIVTKLRSEIFLPSDIIVLAGYAGHAMYFIYMGTVAVYTKYGKEICHLDEGDHFGEIALLINEARVATVIAVKECELFKLSRRDFQEAIEPFPEISKKIRELAMKRLKSTLQMMSEDKDEGEMKIPILESETTESGSNDDT